MYRKKLDVVECLYKDEVACCGEDFCGVVAYLDNNNNDDFDVDFTLAHPLE